MVVGNLVMGERYIEPQGTATILSVNTGDECVITFKPRSMFSNSMHEIVAEIKDPVGNVVYTLEGNFTESIRLFDKDRSEQEIYKAPQNVYPSNCKKYFNLNYFAIQLNQLTDEMQSVLPPTDARFRPDLRAWEDGNFDLATTEKDRMENNQRKRRADVKKIIKQRDGK